MHAPHPLRSKKPHVEVQAGSGEGLNGTHSCMHSLRAQQRLRPCASCTQVVAPPLAGAGCSLHEWPWRTSARAPPLCAGYGPGHPPRLSRAVCCPPRSPRTPFRPLLAVHPAAAGAGAGAERCLPAAAPPCCCSAPAAARPAPRPHGHSGEARLPRQQQARRLRRLVLPLQGGASAPPAHHARHVARLGSQRLLRLFCLGGGHARSRPRKSKSRQEPHDTRRTSALPLWCSKGDARGKT